MKKVDSVKTVTLFVTILCIFGAIFSFTTAKATEKEYTSENNKTLEESTVESDENLVNMSVQDLVITDTITLDIAEGVSQEERDKEALEARKSEVVYEGMTLGELSDQLDRSLNSTLANKGLTFASYATDLGIDPYLAVAIVLHETGCKWSCSNAVNSYNNVGGMMGSGGLLHFDTLDEGIEAYMNNLYNNYVSKGLTTADAIGPKYAASTTWSAQVNSYINQIKAAQGLLFYIIYQK